MNSKMSSVILLCKVLSTFLLGRIISVNCFKIDNALESRVFYGSDASIKEFPYFASLGYCGAGILSDRWIITAAHCVLPIKKSRNRVWVGGERKDNSKELQYDKVIVHPQYQEDPIIINDIALLRLVTPLSFNDKVKPLQLPTKSSKWSTNLLFVGRGRDETNRPTSTIKKLELKRLTGDQCLSHMSQTDQKALKPFIRTLEKAIVCAKRTDDLPGVCMGDSGGPLTQGNTLIGLASFVGDKNCHITRLGFYTNVASYVPWIKSNTKL